MGALIDKRNIDAFTGPHHWSSECSFPWFIRVNPIVYLIYTLRTVRVHIEVRLCKFSNKDKPSWGSIFGKSADDKKAADNSKNRRRKRSSPSKRVLIVIKQVNDRNVWWRWLPMKSDKPLWAKEGITIAKGTITWGYLVCLVWSYSASKSNEFQVQLSCYYEVQNCWLVQNGCRNCSDGENSQTLREILTNYSSSTHFGKPWCHRIFCSKEYYLHLANWLDKFVKN